MTFQERQLALLDDLVREQAEYPQFAALYYRKITQMREAIYGSGAGPEAGGSTGVQDVPGGTAQTL